MAERHCIVGAGPAGLAAARAFLNVGLEIDVFERHTAVGGIWDRANPGTPMYESAHFISSRDMSAYHGYKMPADYPDYPRHDQILDYVRGFAETYNLADDIHFGVGVDMATHDGSHWQVTTSDGQTRAYLTLTCANGTQWHPSRSRFKGEETFIGEIVHSQWFNQGRQFTGKRVLVIGAGNSGVDIACDAARFADHAAISVRRGYYLIPKHIFGKPADEFASTGPHLPNRVAQRVLPFLLKMVMGDPSKHGWPKPDHKILQSHPIVNDQILHHLRHGDLAVRKDIDHLDGADVVFVDGTREPFDIIVAATGYATKVPYLNESVLRWKGNRPNLFLRVFSQDVPGLAAIGFTEGDGGAYELFDNMSDLVARAAWAAEHDTAQYARLRQRFAGPDIDTSGGMNYVASDRHAAYVNLHAFEKINKQFRKEFGWPEVTQETFEHLRRRAPVAGVAGAS